MRLKRLEMVGFKSFSDKTHVEFEPGITAVVGPNGCGKSNIADAIRWSLGEMSPKTLRSQQMLDVIFNGTANRAPQGMSEVSLTFDNTSHRINLDYTEVSIARRLFRSGESEYFINKTQCRLKDVRDLFLDTGIGSDGYYVMQQGKIEFILASKPEERRELFEEAAGVSKYKVRREEALRRLQKVEQDMLRLNDSLAIYKQQMDSLDAAVRKARQHQKLQEELRTLEISTTLQRFKEVQAAWEETHAQQEQESERLAQLKQELAKQEASLAEKRAESEDLEQQVLSFQKQAAQCESEWAKTEAERQAAVEREGELKIAQTRLEGEIAQLQNSLEEGRQKQTALVQEVADLQSQYHKKNDAYKAHEQQGHGEQAALIQLQKDLEHTKARLLELVRLISHHRNETVRLTSLSVRQEEASKAKQREFDKVQLRRGALAEQIQQQEQLAQTTQSRLTAAQKALETLENAHRQEAQRLAETEEAIQSSRERLARLEAEKISLERSLGQDPVARAAVALQQEALPGIYGPLGVLFKTDASHQRLLDRALGDRRHYFIADSLNDAQAAIRFLSDQRQGWATFLVLDRLTSSNDSLDLPPAPSETRSLADMVECDEKFRPVLDRFLGKTYYVGATLFEEHLLRGGADLEQEGMPASAGDLTRLTEDLSTLQETLKSLASAREQLKTALDQRVAEKAPFEAEKSRVHVLAQVQQETLNRFREDLQMAETEERLLKREREECEQAIAQAQKSLQDEEILLTNLETEEENLQQSVRNQESSLHALRDKVQAHQAVVSQLRLEAETTRERLLGKQQEEENARRQVSSLEQRHQQDETEYVENSQRLIQLASTQQEKAQVLASLRETKEAQNVTLSDLLKCRQGVQEHLRDQEQALSSRRDALSEVQTRAQEAEFQARSLEQERARLESTLKDTYQLSIEEAQSHYGEVQPNPEELARIKRRLDSLGAVNLAAPEEHAQLEERYHFLLTQQQDLLKAKEDLHQAIAKINATTREHFKTTFELVRQNFKTLYQTLFQGGESDLILTDEQNLLETGVDIMAQPPGKKLQNIALLSGGEKALTAIALLFAFFMVKPSPFCLLDEVDAPLDEANVGRFIRMVKSFSEKTQFIVITHNKRTMETADVLYGVTMAELGVSSLISVKLESPTKEGVAA